MSGPRAPTPSASTMPSGRRWSRANTVRRPTSSTSTPPSWWTIAKAPSASRRDPRASLPDVGLHHEIGHRLDLAPVERRGMGVVGNEVAEVGGGRAEAGLVLI